MAASCFRHLKARIGRELDRLELIVDHLRQVDDQRNALVSERRSPAKRRRRFGWAVALLVAEIDAAFRGQVLHVAQGHRERPALQQRLQRRP